MAAVTKIETPESPELRTFYERIAGASGGLGVLNVFKVMAHSPEVMAAWWDMMALLFTKLELSHRHRELAILRLFQIKGGEYGFAHHVRIGRRVGITDEQVAALDSYGTSPLFDDDDRLVLRYTEAVTLLRDDAPSLAQDVKARLGERQLVELTFCIGNWNMMAHLLLPLQIELEDVAQEYLVEGWRG